MARKPGLGKGLDAIFQTETSETTVSKQDLNIPVSKITYNPHQPRHIFNDKDLE